LAVENPSVAKCGSRHDRKISKNNPESDDERQPRLLRADVHHLGLEEREEQSPATHPLRKFRAVDTLLPTMSSEFETVCFASNNLVLMGNIARKRASRVVGIALQAHLGYSFLRNPRPWYLQRALFQRPVWLRND
jgi:hypothetical protein